MHHECGHIEIPEEIISHWQSVVDVISDLFAVPSAMINKLDETDLEVIRSNVSPENPFPSGTKMPKAGIYCEYAAHKRQMVCVPDARRDPFWADSPTAKAGIYAYLGYPLFWPNGEVFGTICAIDIRENLWGDRSEKLLFMFKGTVEAHLALMASIDELDRKNRDLEKTLKEVKTLRGLLPICASCKKIRDDKGYWNQIEVYIGEHSEARFSHGICPECGEKYYAELKKQDRV